MVVPLRHPLGVCTIKSVQFHPPESDTPSQPPGWRLVSAKDIGEPGKRKALVKALRLERAA